MNVNFNLETRYYSILLFNLNFNIIFVYFSSTVSFSFTRFCTTNRIEPYFTRSFILFYFILLSVLNFLLLIKYNMNKTKRNPANAVRKEDDDKKKMQTDGTSLSE